MRGLSKFGLRGNSDIAERASMFWKNTFRNFETDLASPANPKQLRNEAPGKRPFDLIDI